MVLLSFYQNLKSNNGRGYADPEVNCAPHPECLRCHQIVPTVVDTRGIHVPMLEAKSETTSDIISTTCVSSNLTVICITGALAAGS